MTLKVPNRLNLVFIIFMTQLGIAPFKLKLAWNKLREGTISCAVHSQLGFFLICPDVNPKIPNYFSLQK